MRYHEQTKFNREIINPIYYIIVETFLHTIVIELRSQLHRQPLIFLESNFTKTWLQLRCVRTTTWIQSGFNLDRLKLDSIHINRVCTILRSVA